MSEDRYSIIYKIIKEVIEDIDPAGFGAKGEYDNVIYKIIKDNQTMKDQNILSKNICKDIADEFGLEENNLQYPCREIAKRILTIYPEGILEK